MQQARTADLLTTSGHTPIRPFEYMNQLLELTDELFAIFEKFLIKFGAIGYLENSRSQLAIAGLYQWAE